jgi:hypothetical protein
MNRFLLATVIACLATSANALNEDAIVTCLVGKATVSLQQQMGNRIDAKTATNVAMIYADKRCKGRISEGASDYVYHSIHGMAKEWFNEDN